MLKLPVSMEGPPIGQCVLRYSGQVCALTAQIFEGPFALLSPQTVTIVYCTGAFLPLGRTRDGDISTAVQG